LDNLIRLNIELDEKLKVFKHKIAVVTKEIEDLDNRKITITEGGVNVK
jgi:hypothetical protein